MATIAWPTFGRGRCIWQPLNPEVSPYKLTEAAVDDLTRIFLDGIARFGLAQADEYHAGLTAAFEFSGEFPHAARLREEITPPVRACRYQSHVIVYELIKDDIMLVLRVRHGREDWFVWSEGN